MLAYQGRNELELSPWSYIAPPTLVNPKMESPGHRLVANAELNAFERVAINISLPQARFEAKWQILGDTFHEAKSGNIPLALTSSVAFSHDEDTPNASSTNSVALHEVIYDVALISGYRINEKWLIYGGPFILWDEIKSSYKQGPGFGNIDTDGTLRSFGANLGGEYTFGQAFLRAEFAGTKTRLGQTYSGRGTYGLAMGVRF
jgi:hypothetical protein